MTKTRTPKLYSYRFEIQEDKLGLCFSVIRAFGCMWCARWYALAAGKPGDSHSPR